MSKTRPSLDGINQEKGMTVSGDQRTRERISVYVLNDDLRLTQPIRAAHPFDEIPLYICRESSTNQLLFMQNKPNLRKSQMNLNPHLGQVINDSGENKGVAGFPASDFGLSKLALNWVCFHQLSNRIYFHNPLCKRSLRHLTFFEIGFVWVCFFWA